MPQLIYLASPYTHKDVSVVESRVTAACKYASYLINCKSKFVFSPVIHCHPISKVGALPGVWEYWEKYDTKMIEVCDLMHVLCLEGWNCSVGVQAEIRIAKKLRRHIEYIVQEISQTSTSSIQIRDAHKAPSAVYGNATGENACDCAAV